ncbi:hypothetical protein V5O48_011412 [Marasmius crinis-equi]|uniref:F-box domain-containing protein n=1 Tax=Marasmius crinis-equi TaxID=585013 RepID=A0ABR3F628_9AGAR
MGVLPFDILTEIFWFCLPVGDLTDPKVSDLLSITRVCNYWRVTSLNAPRLWAFISLSDFTADFHLPMFQLGIERSGTYPLTVALRHGQDADSRTRDQIYSILAQQYHRLKALTLFLDAYGAQEPIIPTLSSAVPILELVRVVDRGFLEPTGSDSDTSANTGFWQPICLSPSIKSVIRLDGLNRWHSRAFLDLSMVRWEALTHLEGAFHYNMEFINFLNGRCCRSLEILIIRRMSRMPAKIEYGMISLPRLRELDICSHNLSFFISHLTLPRLENLTICYAPTTKFYHPSWLDLFQRSSCRLRSLKMYGAYLNTPDESLHFLLSSSALKDITSLHMTFQAITNLTWGSKMSSPVSFPQLETLNLEVESWTRGRLFGMVDLHCRTPGTHPTLKSASIKVADVLFVNINTTEDWQSFCEDFDSRQNVHYTYIRET